MALMFKRKKSDVSVSPEMNSKKSTNSKLKQNIWLESKSKRNAPAPNLDFLDFFHVWQDAFREP